MKHIEKNNNIISKDKQYFIFKYVTEFFNIYKFIHCFKVKKFVILFLTSHINLNINTQLYLSSTFYLYYF